MSEKLRNCPHCGGNAKLKEISGRWTVHCENHCSGTRIFNDKDKPIIAWNHRTPKIIRCGECKYWQNNNGGYPNAECRWGKDETPNKDDFCSYGERREEEG